MYLLLLASWISTELHLDCQFTAALAVYMRSTSPVLTQPATSPAPVSTLRNASLSFEKALQLSERNRFLQYGEQTNLKRRRVTSIFPGASSVLRSVLKVLTAIKTTTQNCIVSTPDKAFGFGGPLSILVKAAQTAAYIAVSCQKGT